MQSQELQSLDAFLAMMTRVLQDAVSRLANIVTVVDEAADPDGTEAISPTAIAFSDLLVSSFRQTWSDSSCGFGGIALQALTDAQTVVVGRTDGSCAVVYTRGDFAYRVDQPSEAFWAHVQEQRLPGASNPWEAFA